jgi:hypothetical protein
VKKPAALYLPHFVEYTWDCQWACQKIDKASDKANDKAFRNGAYPT